MTRRRRFLEKSQPDDVFIQLQSEAAAYCGRDERTFRRWQRQWPFKPEWKTEKGWNVTAIIAERDRRGLTDSEVDGDRKDLRTLLDEEKLAHAEFETRRLEREEQIEIGNLLPRDEYQIFANEIITEARDAFLNIPVEMQKHIPAKHRAKITDELNKQIETALNRLAKLPDGPAPNDK